MLAIKSFITSVTAPADIEIIFSDEERRKHLPLSKTKPEDLAILYETDDPVSGVVNITPLPGKIVAHNGIKIQLIGQIELSTERGRPFEFTSLEYELEAPGNVVNNVSYDFDFSSVEKPHETYNGTGVKLRYFVRVTITRLYAPNITNERDFIVHSYSNQPAVNQPIRMEVGIEDSVHLEFEYQRCKYNLTDIVVGKVYFLLVRLPIKYMEVALIKREIFGSNGASAEGETIARYEVMDGSVTRGESIPIRFQLGAYDLTPTLNNIQNKFSVKYFLNLVLISEDKDQRYFKQSEIVLFRHK
ncbi:hypothetical protein RCL1_003097 [Eukaryota sp. TZLM3-RCL]